MIRREKERQGLIGCDKKSAAWKLILKLPKNGFLSNLGDQVWQRVTKREM